MFIILLTSATAVTHKKLQHTKTYHCHLQQDETLHHTNHKRLPHTHTYTFGHHFLMHSCLQLQFRGCFFLLLLSHFFQTSAHFITALHIKYQRSAKHCIENIKCWDQMTTTTSSIAVLIVFVCVLSVSAAEMSWYVMLKEKVAILWSVSGRTGLWLNISTLYFPSPSQ